MSSMMRYKVDIAPRAKNNTQLFRLPGFAALVVALRFFAIVPTPHGDLNRLDR